MYNDNDKYCVAWLENLINAGHLPSGRVDSRGIQEIKAEDCEATSHFFAGIGGWALALRQAGWPEERPVWTGSCPCQPFSLAGQKTGIADARHLWPEWFRLIRECRPPVIFGEQVASSGGLAWLDIVQADLEREGYSVGALDLCAAGFGAPHIRQRLYFVAHADRGRRQQRDEGKREVSVAHPHGNVGDTEFSGLEGQPRHGYASYQSRWIRKIESGPIAEAGDASNVADADGRNASAEGIQRGREQRQQPQDGATNGYWSYAEWLDCTDGKARPTEPGLFPLAYGIPGRVGRLRAYGNAVVVPQAVEFIRAYLDE